MTLTVRLARAAWFSAIGAAGCSALFGDDLDKYHRRNCAGADRATVQCASTSGGTAGVVDGGAGSGGAPPTDAGTDASWNGGSAGNGGTSEDGADATDAQSDADYYWRPPVRTKRVQEFADIVIPVCFMAAPHRVSDSEIHCPYQSEYGTCEGKPFDYLKIRQSLRTLLEETWGSVTTFQFVGFDVCPLTSGSNHDIRVPGGIMVTFTAEDADASSGDTSVESATRAVSGFGKPGASSADVHVAWQGLESGDADALRAILREFGRVLGFPYEWVRGSESEAPKPCPASLSPDPQRSALFLGGLVDYDSVMDRCAPRGKEAKLSPGDVIAAQAIYGSKHSGAIVNRGQCLTTTPSYLLDAKLCSYTWRDTWDRAEDSKKFQIRGTLATLEDSPLLLPLCMGLNNSGVFGPNPFSVVTTLCVSMDSSSVPLSRFRWRAMGTMCVEARHDDASGRDVLVLAECAETEMQLWNFWGGDLESGLGWNQIQSVGTGKCVSVSQEGVLDYPVILADCSPAAAAQRLEYLEGGFIQESAGHCLSVSSRTPSPGARVGLSDGCSDASRYDSRFYVSGPLSLFGKCITSPATSDSCVDGLQSQTWDYHF